MGDPITSDPLGHELTVESRQAVEGALTTARELLGMDAAYLAEFVDGRQVYRALEGDAESFDMRLDDGPPAEGTYCARMLSGRLPNAIPDAHADERVRDLAITQDVGIGAYAAVPLRFPDGTRGSLCCLSHAPDSSLADRDLRFMHALARLVEDHLKQREADRIARSALDSEVIRATAELRTALAQLASSRAEMVLRLSRALDYRDDDTGAHTERVGRASGDLARWAGLDSDRCEAILIASPLHDAGKVAIPDAILLKPGRLTDEEREVMETHATLGHELLRNSAYEALDLAATIACTHHERYDGSGYPRGLAGEAIPVEGRIVAIVDVYDALTHDRVYRPAFPREQALEMMVAGRETHFDPWLLDRFVAEVRDGDDA
jgi:HD-GYP domain-containing protein (c-di-GMP phosphodiesterase class II)